MKWLKNAKEEKIHPRTEKKIIANKNQNFPLEVLNSPTDKFRLTGNEQDEEDAPALYWSKVRIRVSSVFK